MQQEKRLCSIKGNKSEIRIKSTPKSISQTFIGNYPLKKEFLVGLKDKYPANVLPEATEELPVARGELLLPPDKLLLPPDKLLLSTDKLLLLPDKHLLPPDKHLLTNDKKTTKVRKPGVVFETSLFRAAY